MPVHGVRIMGRGRHGPLRVIYRVMGRRHRYYLDYDGFKLRASRDVNGKEPLYFDLVSDDAAGRPRLMLIRNMLREALDVQLPPPSEASPNTNPCLSGWIDSPPRYIIQTIVDCLDRTALLVDWDL